ncbi:protein IQ-DOMAIN 32 isoform X2 [Malania oleifera]|uniref:protein IQ-DOMAIN 32 isoform X2 n=1 Tax=Malania oleifera TaxID=397392 RepID=UPI0025ADE1F8|nr:protein IQ-DOMAIN 32 isoform X2 [Malania oleifera]
MGRSASCFKIITCGSDAVDNGDLEASESKGSSDKRGWSFRKRSARHRVLSNTVTSEAPSGNKDNSESATINIETPINSSVPEKISKLQWPDDKTQFSASGDSKVSETLIATESETKVDTNLEKESKVDTHLEESLAIIIQTAIRGFLAHEMLLKHKNAVKLQAAVRGHLVRRHAVGTLRCVQAIVKMQALVRARRARLSLEESNKEEKLAGNNEKGNDSSRPLDHSLSKSKVRSASIEKLLSNGFARQLMESTSKTKPINIRCDPSKPNSAWTWLERWMSVSSSNLTKLERPESNVEQQEQEKAENCAAPVEVDESADMESFVKEMAVPFESEESLITYEAENFEFHTGLPSTTSKGDDNADTSNVKIESDPLLNQNIQSDGSTRGELNSLTTNPAMDSEQPKRSMKRFASEQLETDGKKFVFGSRKSSNPAFVAAQSKFEELSSSANPGRSVSSSNQDTGLESNLETVSSAVDSVIQTKELGLAENSVPNNLRVQVGGSECGTELSVTSTLDSPDVSEVGVTEYEHETKVPEGVGNLNSTDNQGVETPDVSANTESNPSHSLPVQPGKTDGVNIESANSVVVVASLLIEEKPERTASDLQVELGSETGRQAYRSSSEASPRSHVTVPESQGTPASQLSVNAKRSKTDKSGSNHRRRSLSAGKKSPSNPNYDSGARSSTDQLPKDQKTGKRRSSFGLPRADNVDQEPRDSTSSSSILPSYMQPTESARAKAYASNSPRSSPDVQDKELYAKKRHSLPCANGRQGSPRIQRSTSQAQQGAKGNGAHPHERKWQR